MSVHKRIRRTPLDRSEIWQFYQTSTWKVTHLAEHIRVSRPTIYVVLKRARLQGGNSTNQRFKSIQYGLKRPAQVEPAIEDRLKCEANLYYKSCTGELVHFNTMLLPPA